VSRRDAGTYLYVKDGAQPREAVRLPTRVQPLLDAPKPVEPISRLRLVRPTMHAGRCDPRVCMVHCPDSAQGDAIRAAANGLLDIEGPIVIAGTANAPVARMAIDLSAALVETGGFAALIDGRGGLADALGIDRFDGLLNQHQVRQHDPQRPLELLYITWRCALLPLEAERDAPAHVLQAACDAVERGSTYQVIAAPACNAPGFRDIAALGTTVLIATADDVGNGGLASAITSVAGSPFAGVVIAEN
jgi:hypothetical protein